MADQAISAVAEVSVPALDDVTVWVDTGSTTRYKISAKRLLGLNNHVCQGRLTLTTLVPITSTDVTGASARTIYFTPFRGNKIAVYDGTRWQFYAFTEISLALGTLTATLPYDVFIYDNSGTLTLEFTAWTNATTRATALVLQDGIYCKTGVLTRRYLGTFYTVNTTDTEDSLANRFVYNFYNQVDQNLKRAESTSHTINNTALREWNAATASRVHFVCGAVGRIASIGTVTAMQSSGLAAPYVLFGPALNSTTALHLGGAGLWRSGGPADFANSNVLMATTVQPVLGLNYVTTLEQEGASATATMTGCVTQAVVKC